MSGPNPVHRCLRCRCRIRHRSRPGGVRASGRRRAPRAVGLLPAAVVTLLLAAAPARAALLPFTAGVGTLATPEWSLKAEGATVVQTVSPGSGVSFRFFDFTAPSALVRDAFSVQPAYGQVPGSHANGDFSNRSGFALRLRNDGAAAVWASLVINTGFTGPSGTPSFDSANDTFWQSAWTHLDPGAGLRLLLNFDAAIPWNVEDNPLPHTQGGTDGVAMAINAFDRA